MRSLELNKWYRGGNSGRLIKFLGPARLDTHVMGLYQTGRVADVHILGARDITHWTRGDVLLVPSRSSEGHEIIIVTEDQSTEYTAYESEAGSGTIDTSFYDVRPATPNELISEEWVFTRPYWSVHRMYEVERV